MKRAWIVAIIAAGLGCGTASAQVRGASSAPAGMGTTSPLGGPAGSPVQPTGIPMGATELATPGLSPIVSPSPFGLTSSPTSGNSVCVSVLSSTSQTSAALFDGGMAAGGPSTCAATTGTASGSAITTSPIGRSGVPLGSTEIANAGLSPMSPLPALVIPPTASSTLNAIVTCPSTGASPTPTSSNGISMPSTVASTGC